MTSNTKTSDENVTETYPAVQLIRGLRLAWSPSRVITDELIQEGHGIKIERQRSFPAGIVITNDQAPDGRARVSLVPWTSVVVAHR